MMTQFKYMGEILFSGWLFLLPLITYKGYYEGPKVWLFLIASFCLTLFLLWKKSRNLGIFFKQKLYVFWLIILTAASFFGVHWQESILGGSYRHQGVIFFFSLLVLMMFLKLLKQKSKNLIFSGLAAVVLFESLLVIFQKIFSISLLNARPMGTFGEPNAAAGFLAIGAFFADQGFNQLKISAKFRIFLLFLILVAVLLTGSRAGILSFALVLIGIIFKSSQRQKIFLLARKHVFLVLALIMFSLLIVTRGFLERQNSLFENRNLFWQIAWEKIQEKPLLGYGAESGEVVYDLAYQEREMPLVDLMIDRSHNLFLDVLLWSGGLGFLFFGFWLVSALRELEKAQKWDRVLAFLGWLVFAGFQPLGVVHWIFLILVLYL